MAQMQKSNKQNYIEFWWIYAWWCGSSGFIRISPISYHKTLSGFTIKVHSLWYRIDFDGWKIKFVDERVKTL